MHDIRLIREDPQAFDDALARRGFTASAQEVLAFDERRRAAATKAQDLLARRNEASKAIGAAMGRGDNDGAEALKAEVAAIKTELPALEDEERAAGTAQDNLLASIPNLPAEDVPEGEDEAGNVEVACWGSPRNFAFQPQEHADFGPALGLDFETGAAIAGARFTFLKGQMARLQRALAQFMLDAQTMQHGFIECATPLLVREEAMFGTGQLPKFAEDSFATTDGRWLIPTSEVSLTNSVREQIIDLPQPLRLTALTPCFRSEAGSAGRDTRGYIRQHQFDKVELVSICRPDDAEGEHQHMLRSAQTILERLELPYRTMLLCAGDMGFGAKRTYDLEVWLPGQSAYREISSISWCGDFQARRMNARYRAENGKPAFVHTLNGSGLAVGRTLVAVLENYQQEDGSVIVPEALKPWAGGLERLVPTA
ncbi:serine--tRNA ligase [Altererythrobacter sp. TH136]|uniref:serine--tRNA ligase n=1 Tax=Altererythrobacter sp. TH136 TaxID=2067415 RepID=UPI001163F5A4|nr:serine--tRNA ligase [Altererythrobacter sp. TH136]QDM41522.1 serine--tRNA ligase [Altererythrobacter sp. TH136]